VTELPPLELGWARTELRRELVDAVLRGDKTATAGLPEEGEELSRSGDRLALLDFDDEPVAIVEVTEIRVVPAGRSTSSSRATKARASSRSRTGGSPTRSSSNGRCQTTRRSSRCGFD
jgi:hypothetical protein